MTRTKRVILALVSVIVVVVIVATIVIAVLYNTTFEKMGLSNKAVLNGKTISDMNLQDYTPRDLAPLVKSLFKDNSALVKYPPQSDDMQVVNKAFEKSDIAGLTEIHYSRLIYRSATFLDSRLLLFTDKQLSALLNKVVKQAPNDLLLSTSADILEFLGVRAIKDVLACLEEYDVTVEQIQLTAQDGKPHLQMLLSLDISKHTQGVRVPFLGSLNPHVYVALDYSLNVTVDGKIDLTFVSLSVNGKDPELSEKVLDGLFVALNNSDIGNLMTTQSLADGVAAFVGVVFEHIGFVGNDAAGSLLPGVDTTNKTICFVVV